MMSRVQVDLSICVTYYGRKTPCPKTQILDPNFTFPHRQMIASHATMDTTNFRPFLLPQSPEHFLRLARWKIDFGKVKNGSTPFCLGPHHRVFQKKKGWFARNFRGLEKDCRRPCMGCETGHSYRFLMVGIIWVSSRDHAVESSGMACGLFVQFGSDGNDFAIM